MLFSVPPHAGVAAREGERRWVSTAILPRPRGIIVALPPVADELVCVNQRALWSSAAERSGHLCSLVAMVNWCKLVWKAWGVENRKKNKTVI